MATLLTSDAQAVAQVLASDSVSPLHQLGTRVVSPDGRVYRYVKAGATALIPGRVQQAPAEATGVQNLACAAAAVGDTTITTTSTVTVTANQYAGGYVNVAINPGAGYQYLIKSHPAATGAVVTLTLEDPIAVALTTVSRIDMVANPFSGVVIMPLTATSTPVGVAVYPITAAYYGWIQTGGICNVQADGAITVGSLVGVSTGTIGAVINASSTTLNIIGIAQTGIATTDFGAVKLTIDQ